MFLKNVLKVTELLHPAKNATLDHQNNKELVILKGICLDNNNELFALSDSAEKSGQYFSELQREYLIS